MRYKALHASYDDAILLTGYKCCYGSATAGIRLWQPVTSIMIAAERRRRSVYKFKFCWRLSTCGL